MNKNDETAFRNSLVENFENSKHKNWSLLDIYSDDLSYFNKLRDRNRIPEEMLRFITIEKKKIGNAQDIKMDEFRRLAYENIINEYLSGNTEKLEIKKIEKQTVSHRTDVLEEKIIHKKKKPKATNKAKKKRKNKGNVNTNITGKATKKVTKKPTKKPIEPVGRKYSIKIKKYNGGQNFPVLLCPHDATRMNCESVAEESDAFKVRKIIPLYACKSCGRKYTHVQKYCDEYPVRLFWY